MLGELHTRRATSRMTDARRDREAMTWGEFVGEVIRRIKGGRWAKDHAAAGPDTYPLDSDGQQSFPVGWRGRRIKHGDEGDVWLKFRFFALGEGLDGAVVIDGSDPTPPPPAVTATTSPASAAR